MGDEIPDIFVIGNVDPWKATIESRGRGYWVEFHSGFRSEVNLHWRPTRAMAEGLARRGVRRRNREDHVRDRWTIE